jgi:hypothetical protein
LDIYLAARYSRHPEMRELRDMLHDQGHTVTSRWIDLHKDENSVEPLGPHESSATAERLNEDPDSCRPFALHDLDDIETADVVVSFTGIAGGKGGRHVEFGYGFARGKTMVIVGPNENIFHTLAPIHLADPDAFLEWTARVSLAEKTYPVRYVTSLGDAQGVQLGGGGGGNVQVNHFHG